MPVNLEFFSPLTGRPIKKGSLTYESLIKRGLKPIPRTSKWASYRQKMPTSKRQSLKQRCGSKCFLSPEDLHYPICDPDKNNCKTDCSMVAGAMRKAELVEKNPRAENPQKRKRGSKIYKQAKALLGVCTRSMAKNK